MNLYRGHILLALSVCFGLVATVDVLLFFLVLEADMNDWRAFALFLIGALSAIVCLTTAAISYAQWVPEWERQEKRTGHIPGEGRMQ